MIVDNWISVREDLPLEGQKVLAIIQYSRSAWEEVEKTKTRKILEKKEHIEQYPHVIVCSDGFSDYNKKGSCITHWLPLPEFPTPFDLKDEEEIRVCP